MNTNGSSRAANPQTTLTEITTSGVLQKKTEAFRTTGVPASPVLHGNTTRQQISISCTCSPKNSLISKEPGLPDKEPGINGYATFNVSANGPHVHEYLQEMRQKALNNAAKQS